MTGGSRGIGRAVALMLARQGMHVAICGRTEESLKKTASDIRALGVQSWLYRADVSHLEDVERFVADAVEAAGHVDVLVNNAVTSTSASFYENRIYASFLGFFPVLCSESLAIRVEPGMR